MKKTYTKLPLILLTLLNYAPFAHPTSKATKSATECADDTNKCGCSHADETTTPTETPTNEVNVETAVAEFMQAQIPEDFDSLFNAHFTANVDERHAFVLLAQMPVNLPIQQSESSYTAQDLANQAQTILNLSENKSFVEITAVDSDYRAIVPYGSLQAFGCNTLNKATIYPEQNMLLLHLENDQIPNMSYVGLINTRTLASLVVPCAASSAIKEIGLVANASELAIMRQDDTILAYTLPTEFSNFAPTLKQRAFISYVEARINLVGQKIAEYGAANSTNNALRIYAQLPQEEIFRLGTLIFTNPSMLPESLYNTMYTEKINWLQQILTISANTKFIAESLKLDVNTLIDKIESNEITQEQIQAILSPEVSSDIQA